MKSRRLISMVVVAATSLSLIGTGTPFAGASPAANAAPAASSGPVASCATPPTTADATVENRDKFVQLWLPRVKNSAWLKSWTGLNSVPADVAAEGFHAMDVETQAWLIACLVDQMVAAAGQTATPEKIAQYQAGLTFVIFGKNKLADLRQGLNNPASPTKDPKPLADSQATQTLNNVATGLATQPSLKSADQPPADPPTPTTSSTPDLSGATSPALKKLVSQPQASPTMSRAAAPAPAGPTPQAVNPNDIVSSLTNFVTSQLVPFLLKAVAEVLKLVAQIQQQLFTIPGVNVLAAAFYRVCAESATQPLACSVYLPVGVPNLVDVTGDNVPDVFALLFPEILVGDVGVQFQMSRLFPNSGPLPAHVFVVYDPPIVKKRMEFGVDGRASTLAAVHVLRFMLNHPITALAGDVEVSGDFGATAPGSTEALTFAIKNLVGGSLGVPPTEADPTAGAVQFSPFPTRFQANAHLLHNSLQDRDTFTLQSSTPSTVNALITQDTTTTAPKSHREFTALVDQLPTSVTVDLTKQNGVQNINYSASAAIAKVRATDTAVPDTSQPGSYTRAAYEVQGVPTSVNVALKGAQDITYTANGSVNKASFLSQTYDTNVLQKQIAAFAEQIPNTIHVVNTTGADQTLVTYDASGVLGKVGLSMYDKAQDETNLVATATSIPSQMSFSQTKSKGTFEFNANAGIGRINAQFSRALGSILPLAGDHATVLKVGNAIGLSAQLSGFKSAFFDGSAKTLVKVGLDPGGQEFNALADLDSPNVLAKVRVSNLPSSMQVSIDPANGKANYTASSIIPSLEGSFTERTQQMFASVKLTNIPKNIALTFATTGPSPSVTYEADSRLGKIEATYQKAPNDLALNAVITDLPQFMLIGGTSPIVFDARNASGDAPGSSYLGQVLFKFTTNGVFSSPATTDDHLYLKTTGGVTQAELLYTGLKYLSANTANQELHAEIRNTAPRLLRAYLITDTLTATGFIDKVPASVKVDQVGKVITYTASDPITQIFTDVQRANGDSIQATVKNIPNTIAVTFDGAASQLLWNASDVTGEFSVQAHLTPATLGGTRAFDAGLSITGIPAQWSANWANGNVVFNATGTGIALITLAVTNHGTYHTQVGDHLAVFYDQPSGDLDATLQVSRLVTVGFTKLTGSNGGGFQADLNMGSHGSLGLFASVNLGSNRLLATGGFDHLPSTIHLVSNGGRIQYNGNDNPTLTLYIEAGNPTALTGTPNPPSVHGVSVRDGISAGNRSVKARLFLTGLPDTLDLNSPAGTYTVNGYHPSISTLVVDVVLTTLAAQPLSLQLQQGVPTASPVNFTFGPFLSSTAGDGTHTLSLNYTSNQDLGQLIAEATYGNTDDAKLTISEIPKSISVNAAFGGAQKSVNLTMNHGITEITAAYKHAGDINFAASVKLHDVPSAVNLLLGRASSGDGSVSTPDFTFTTSAAGMDIDAFASAAITSPVDAHAAAVLQVTNLGQTVTGQMDGTTLKINSTPATEKFLLSASGAVHLNFNLAFSAGPFDNTGSLGVNIDIRSLVLGFENASSLQLDLGITTGLMGDFSSFTFGLDTETVITLQDTLDFSIGTPFGDVSFNIFDVHPTTINLHNVIDHFRVLSNRYQTLFTIEVIDVIAGYCGFDVKIRPFPDHSTSGSSFTVGPPPSDGTNPAAWLILPDPNLLGFSLPDFAVDIIAYFTSPYGHHLGGKLACHSRI